MFENRLLALLYVASVAARTLSRTRKGKRHSFLQRYPSPPYPTFFLFRLAREKRSPPRDPFDLTNSPAIPTTPQILLLANTLSNTNPITDSWIIHLTAAIRRELAMPRPRTMERTESNMTKRRPIKTFVHVRWGEESIMVVSCFLLLEEGLKKVKSV